jgi:iron(III) transport system permease protein
VRNSLLYSLASTAITVVLGLAAAVLVVRGGGRRGALLDSLMMVPLAVPGLVLAFGYLGAYSGLRPEVPAWLASGAARDGLQNALTAVCAAIDPLRNPAALLILAYAVRRVPLVFRSATAGLEQCPGILEEASRSLGAGPLLTLRRVTLPLVGANLAAGGVLAFSYAMLEVSDSMILALDRAHYPITKVIYTLFGRIGDGEGVACAMGLLAMLILAASLFSAAMFVGRRMGQMFRV